MHHRKKVQMRSLHVLLSSAHERHNAFTLHAGLKPASLYRRLGETIKASTCHVGGRVFLVSYIPLA